MGTGWSGIRAEVAALAAAFDPSLLSPAAASEVLAHVAAIENIAATVKALAARRAADSGAWRREGAASPAHDLARKTGASVTAARAALDTAEKLTALPALDAAARAGSLSAAQAAPIADAAAADPAAEARLVAKARRASLGELRDECARTKAAALPDDAARHAAVHRNRHLRHRRCPDGAGELIYRSTLDEVAEILAVVHGYANRQFDLARLDGRRETEDAYLADGLLAACRAATTTAAGATSATPVRGKRVRKPTSTKVVVRIDWDALTRGWPTRGEVSEIAGLGPVPVTVVRTMLATGDPFLAAVVTKGVDVATVAHLGRRPTAHQSTALDWLSPTCTTEGCNRTDRLETDHREDWAHTKITLLRALERHCHPCHDKKTRLGWALVPGHGKRPLVPPDDPRHPANRPPPTDTS